MSSLLLNCPPKTKAAVVHVSPLPLLQDIVNLSRKVKANHPENTQAAPRSNNTILIGLDSRQRTKREEEE
ncbi:unnamed protein product [Allacma fusca]|uniref:Uncharacterized protein n=1 Tax=Allacma fusca TaxID=39272 RepID=A0A8J2PF44_9HEXA|nr:unnamed protein product [Allacma fusca]